MNKQELINFIKQQITPFFQDGQTREIRALNHKTNEYLKTVSGYFNDIDKFAEAAAKLSGWYDGIYFTPNPVNPDLLARANNRTIEKPKNTTSDADIIRRSWILIDVDPIRPAGISSNEEEHEAALSKISEIKNFLDSQGWGEIQYIKADSGNGGHLLYATDLDNNEESKNIIEKFLKYLDFEFTDDRVSIDLKVFNAARIWKLYGTLACKGDSTEDRPHRIAHIFETSGTEKVTFDQISAIAALMPDMEEEEYPAQTRQYYGGGRQEFNIEEFISKHNIKIHSTKTWNGGTIWITDCPWNPDHPRDARIGQQANGAIWANCKHNSCNGKKWRDFRLFYDPDAYNYENKNKTTLNPKAERQIQKIVESQPEYIKSGNNFSGDEVAPFPLEALPNKLKEFISDVSKTFGFPPDFVAIPTITILGAALGSHHSIEIKRGFVEKPNIFTAIVSPSGTGKSPALKIAFEPVEIKQNRAAEEYELEMINYNEDMAIYEHAVKKAGKGENLPERPKKPILREYFCDNSTAEALCQILPNNRRGIILKQDELTAWVTSMNQYKGGKGNDRETYLSLWSGSAIKINRIGRPVIIIRNPFVAVTGCLPPSCINRLVEDASQVEDGFMQRILWAYPNSEPQYWNERELLRDTNRKYQQLYEKISEQLPLLDQAENQIPVKLNTEAYEIWKELYNKNIDEIKASEFPSYLIGAWSKMSIQLARITLILHLVRYYTGETASYDVDKTSMLMGCSIIEYFKSHACRVYKIIGEKILQEKYIKIVAYMKERSMGKISARDLQRAGFYSTAEEAKAILEEMEIQGYFTKKEEEQGRGRKKTVFILNNDFKFV
jgi:hypothetical protein